MIASKDDIGIANLLSNFNVRYIFYNSDDTIYGENFSGRPYDQAKKFMPIAQDIYKKLLDTLPLQRKRDIGETYHLYELSNDYYKPHIYAAEQNVVFVGDSLSLPSLPLPLESKNKRVAMHDKESIQKEVDAWYVQPKRKNTLFDTYAKKQQISISNSVSQEAYIALHPLLALFEKMSSDSARKSLKMNLSKPGIKV